MQRSTGNNRYRCQIARQIRSRNPVECLFGVGKRWFPAIAQKLRVRFENTFPIIFATPVLHNIAQQAKAALSPDDKELKLPVPCDVLLTERDISPSSQPAAVAVTTNFLQRRV